MFTPIGKPRKLPYPLYNQVSNSNEVSKDGLVLNPVQWPEDSTERIPIILSVSLDEWNAIASSVDVGADIAYPEQYVSLWWMLTRNLVYSMSICALMIDCIMNDTDVQEALVDTLSQNETFQQFVKESAIRATKGQIVGPVVPTGCDNSAVAGRVIQLTDILDTNNQDFLEIVEVGTNDEERVSLLLAAIPGISESPVDEILDLFQGFLENFQENYNAAVTLSWKNEVSEDLYCLAKQNEDCTLSYEEVFNYFNERAGSNLSIQSIITNIVQFVINGDFSTDDLIASGMYAIQLAFIVAGRDFYGLNIPTIGAVVRDAIPSSAWEDWDECAEPPSGDWVILPAVDNPFTPTQPSGTITSQDATQVTVAASLGSDGTYRVALKHTTGCTTISGGSTSVGVGGDCGCGGWVGAFVIYSPGAYFDRCYAAAGVPFTLQIIN